MPEVAAIAGALEHPGRGPAALAGIRTYAVTACTPTGSTLSGSDRPRPSSPPLAPCHVTSPATLVVPSSLRTATRTMGGSAAVAADAGSAPSRWSVASRGPFVRSRRGARANEHSAVPVAMPDDASTRSATSFSRFHSDFGTFHSVFCVRGATPRHTPRRSRHCSRYQSPRTPSPPALHVHATVAVSASSPPLQVSWSFGASGMSVLKTSLSHSRITSFFACGSNGMSWRNRFGHRHVSPEQPHPDRSSWRYSASRIRPFASRCSMTNWVGRPWTSCGCVAKWKGRDPS